MNTVKYGHKFHPHHPMIDGRDVVLAEDFDVGQANLAELRDALHESEERSESRGRQSSAFENRMGDLQVENGKLKDRLAEADSALTKADDEFSLMSLDAGRRIDSLEGLLREASDFKVGENDQEAWQDLLSRISLELTPLSAAGERDDA